MKKVEDYYDKFSSQQVKTGINKRHRSIHQWLLKMGLQPHHNCLEIGCGIGTQTELLAGYIKTGSILAVDISPESIKIARERLKEKKNVSLIAVDITQYKIDDKFDVLVLPDVLEHIPIELHKELFAKMATLLKPDGFIFIHIPNPYYLEWCHQNTPELLQIIDQPLYTDLLTPNIYAAGLYIHTLITYSVWIDNGDHQVILLKPRRELDYKQIVEKATVTSRIKHKIKKITGK